MAAIYQHYLEVEGLLQDDVATTIATSFEASKNRSRGRGGEVSSRDAGASGVVKMKGKDSNRISKAASSEGIDEEAGETIGLLSSSEKEQKRERLATLALHGKYFVWLFSQPS
jgi:hypothetical protein